MITNECVAHALDFQQLMNTAGGWASLEASVIEGYCRVKWGYIHDDGTKEQPIKIYDFKEMDGVIVVSNYVKN